jgi:hypothetical protein
MEPSAKGRFEQPIDSVNITRLQRMADAAGVGGLLDDFVAGWKAGVKDRPKTGKINEAYQAGYRAGQKDRK